jgi:hypothetical protein
VSVTVPAASTHEATCLCIAAVPPASPAADRRALRHIRDRIPASLGRFRVSQTRRRRRLALPWGPGTDRRSFVIGRHVLRTPVCGCAMLDSSRLSLDRRERQAKGGILVYIGRKDRPIEVRHAVHMGQGMCAWCDGATIRGRRRRRLAITATCQSVRVDMFSGSNSDMHAMAR